MPQRMDEPAVTAAASPKYLVMTAGTPGDLYPFMALALELQARGREVALVTNPVYANVVEGAGLKFIAAGSADDFLRLIGNPDLWHARKGLPVILRALTAQWRDLPTETLRQHFPAGRRTVVLAHTLLVPLLDALRPAHPDLRIVGCHLAPTALRSMHDARAFAPLRIPRGVPRVLRQWLWRRFDTRVVDPAVLPDLNAGRDAVGLAPVAHFFEHVAHAADHHVALFPAWFCTPFPDWPPLLAQGDFPLHDPQSKARAPIRLVHFLGDGPPPVVFMPGSGYHHGQHYFEVALQVVQRLGLRAIFLSADRAQVPANLPDEVLWQPYVPLVELLPHAAALVHHGGIGTTAEALRAAVPQVVVPLAYDQFRNATRIHELGVGVALCDAAWFPESPLAERRLQRALTRVLNSKALHERCAEVAWQHFDSPPDRAAVVDAIMTATA